MREPKPDYSSTQYHRPNQPWVCGLASEGHACPAGPSARGQCPALAECAPVRNGDRWVCNRSELRGGVCEAGPTPEGACCRVHKCRPVRSLRGVRARFVIACTLLAAGGLMIVLSTDRRDRAIAPGPLTRHHSQLLDRDGSKPNCSACHSASEQSIGGWTVFLVAGRGNRPAQSQLCIECHGKTISPQLALAPHNLPASVLQQITASHAATKGSELFSKNHSAAALGTENNSGPISRELACATCHREHHGLQFDLTAIDDVACQTCHQQKFESFVKDHPDFGIWPYERRTRIVFNHASHRAKHFAEQKQAFDCRKCHVDGATGQVQLLASFESACASCHDEKIATSVARGVPMLIVPTLDVDAMKAAGHDVGPWPAAATGDFDGRLPPMMKLLLAADADAAHAIGALGTDFDFLDIDPDDPIQLAASAKLATAIKSLLTEVSQRGPLAVRERLSRSLAPHLREAAVAALMAGLSADTMRGAASWFPELDAGNEAWLRDTKTASAATSTARPIAYDPAGTWIRDDATLSIRYRAARHADPVLTAWLEILASTHSLNQHPLAAEMFKELSSPTAAGLCISCHSVEQNAGGTLTINWRAFDRSNQPRPFTKFSHAPHVLLPQLADCTACHAIDDTANTAASYADWNPHQFVSEFQPISKRACASCHTSAAAGDKCQSCHNYHVERAVVRGQGADRVNSAFRPPPSAFD